MSARDELRVYTAKRPFRPFWFSLRDGKRMAVMAPNTAVVTDRRLFFTPDRRQMLHIEWDQVEDYGILPQSNGSRSGEVQP